MSMYGIGMWYHLIIICTAYTQYLSSWIRWAWWYHNPELVNINSDNHRTITISVNVFFCIEITSRLPLHFYLHRVVWKWLWLGIYIIIITPNHLLGTIHKFSWYQSRLHWVHPRLLALININEEILTAKCDYRDVSPFMSIQCLRVQLFWRIWTKSYCDR